MRKPIKTWVLETKPDSLVTDMSKSLDVKTYEGRIKRDYAFSMDIDLDKMEALNKINPEMYPDEIDLLRKFYDKDYFFDRSKNIVKQVRVKYKDNFYCLFDYDCWLPMLERNYWFANDGSDNEMIIIEYIATSIEDSKGNKFDFDKELAKYNK